MDSTPIRSTINSGNECGSRQIQEYSQESKTTPLKPSHYSDPKFNCQIALPKRSQNQNGGPFTPPSMFSSPKFKSTPASWIRIRNLTPNNRNNMQAQYASHNPFETGILDSLSRHMFSPNVFKVPTPNKGTPKFQWSIDDIANLKPTEIDEMPHLDCLMGSDHNMEFEERAQRAIDEYFSSQVIAPSPWSENSKKGQFRSKASDLTPAGKGRLCFKSLIECNPSPAQMKSNKIVKKHVGLEDGTQTCISIPPDVDFDLMIGNCFRLSDATVDELNAKSSKQGKDSGEESEGLNNLSLRRKLFFHHQKGMASPSNRGLETNEEEDDEDDCDDDENFDKTEFEDMEIIAGNGNCEMFASSPIIMRTESPNLERSMFGDDQFPRSPQMSPISRAVNMSQMLSPKRYVNLSSIGDHDTTPKFPKCEISTIKKVTPPFIQFTDTGRQREPSDETGIEHLGIDDHRKSRYFHETMMDIGGAMLGDTHFTTDLHADTGYASNNLGLSGHSNVTNLFHSKHQHQDLSQHGDRFDAKHSQECLFEATGESGGLKTRDIFCHDEKMTHHNHHHHNFFFTRRKSRSHSDLSHSEQDLSYMQC